MYSNKDYAQQVVEGQLDNNTGGFITDDGHQMVE